jgi:hypothetical protein
MKLLSSELQDHVDLCRWMLSRFANRAAECAESSGNIRDDLDEVITLNSVSIIVAEYVPFGSNQVRAPMSVGAPAAVSVVQTVFVVSRPFEVPSPLSHWQATSWCSLPVTVACL